MTIMSQLTERQKQIARLIGQGKQHKEHATELCISINTVKEYLQRAKQRTGCKSAVEIAVRFAVEADRQLTIF